ncbi:hypothetical protein MLD38_040171 [Melastoma candidum]|uniref:Uncharacterized protein n=1 Tax=Melastoma candidum TaxID=119954 RepID=A0ACB9L4W8_9MYRT|nr:hypothetical protein MLD38_040171 [Melastoma candidum]
MGRAPCCDKANVKRGLWSPEEDAKLKDYIESFGTGRNWISLPQRAGLRRCGKSCRLRWLNYLRPNIKHGEFSDEEDRIIFNLFTTIGSRWSIIAAQLPGRTDNDIKNYWNTKLKKKLMGLLPNSRRKPQPPAPLPPPPQLRTTTPTPVTSPFSQQLLLLPQPQSPSPCSPPPSKVYHHLAYINDCSISPATPSSFGTVNSVQSSCHETFTVKDQAFLGFGYDPRSFDSYENQQVMMKMKEESVHLHQDGFDFDQDTNQQRWAEAMSNEVYLGWEYDLIVG